MRRREFITLASGATVAWPLAARAQQSKMPVIGSLQTGSSGASAHLEAAFHRGLEEAGYVEGQNVGIVYRYADGQYDRLPTLATELVRRQVTLIGAFGPPAAHAAKAATTTIPIVFTSSDPVIDGLVSSLNRPGGNATGVNLQTADLESKRLQLLSELLPADASIAALVNLKNTPAKSQEQDIQAAGVRLGRKVLILNASNEREIESSFLTMAELRTAGLLVTGDPFFNSRREQLVALASRDAIAAIYEWREFAFVGGLMTYGSSITDAYRQAGRYAGRILKGEKPNDLPIVQPTSFDLLINLRTAKALKLEIPARLLALANEVIE